ncbi:MAG: GntR family transcriptional regulator [Candidatus Protistobacter heckmanni]|nr:GntR family transcriptional regulator [Candidatus Protistobacter heckmanni]
MTFAKTLNLLKSQSLPGLVQEEIERMILDGRLLPGDPLREVPLSALLGVSRGPIREAFRGLEEKGLVTVVKNCGVFVRTLDPEEADQIYEVREVLEAMIGAKAARHGGAADIADLGKMVEAMRAAVAGADINRYTALNFSFHDGLARLCGNRKPHETYKRLVAELSLFRRHTYVHNESSLALSLSEHEAIYKAVAERRAEAAAELLRLHVRGSRLRLHEVLDAARGSAGPTRSYSPASTDSPETAPRS